MSFDQPKLSDALKPQDSMAVIITLLGVAIAIFLPDAIIKLIGVSIAVLGAVALYITLRQRIADTIALRQRRTTLPPPAFKTHVTTDHATSTKRIRFDDFQDSLGAADDETEEPAVVTASSGAMRTMQETVPSVSVPRETAARRSISDLRFDDLVGDLSVDDSEGHLAPAADEGFRIVRKEPKVATGAKERQVVVSATPGSTREMLATAPSATLAPQSATLDSGSTTVHHVATKPEAPREIETGDGARKTQRRTPSLDLEELIYPETDTDGASTEPRGEFVRLVGQLLRAVGRSIEARSIIFFWINSEKGHLIPEAHVTSGSVDIRTSARIPLGNDIVSQIARSQTAEIITDISFMSERELICYYAASSSTRSFVGVPVFYRREVVGVLAADSADEDAFSEASVATLAEYTRLIAGLIRSYTEKYDLHLIARTLDAFESMSRDFSGAEPTPARVAEALTTRVAELFDHRYVATVLFDDKSAQWRVYGWHGDGVVGTLAESRVDVRGSLVGRATRNADEVLVQGNLSEIRFHADEQLPDRGTFLAVPLVGTSKCYGAIAIEHPLPEAYIPRDVELMRDLTRYAAMAIEVFNTNRAIESHTMVDETTGLFNADFLLSALDREIARAHDFRGKVSVALIAIDLPASLRAERSTEVEEVITASVGAMVQESIRPYDTAGRLDDGIFAVVLASRGDQDAYLWGERLRKDVASRIIAMGRRKSAVTISIGICDLGDPQGRDAMVDGARKALERARAGEGNAVILY